MIDIKTYAVPKQASNGAQSTVVINNNSTTGGGGAFSPVRLWGQYFDDTHDLSGDMTVNGRVTATQVDALDLTAERAQIRQLTAQGATFSTMYSDEILGDFLDVAEAMIERLSSKEITTEYLTVTKAAHFFELIIDKIRSSGGSVIFTPADGFKCDKVEKISGGYRLWWRATDDDRQIHNMWRAQDQALCQSFNDARTGRNEQISSKYYWALVTETNNETENGAPLLVNLADDGQTEDLQACHYIDISTSVCDGAVEPEVGDEICQLGYRGQDDVERQSAIYIASYASLDNELRTPLICQYRGINDFDLASHKYTWFSSGVTPKGRKNGRRANEIRGEFRVSDGMTISEYVTSQQVVKYRLISDTAVINVDKQGTQRPTNVALQCITTSGGTAQYSTLRYQVATVDINGNTTVVSTTQLNANGQAQVTIPALTSVRRRSLTINLLDAHDELLDRCSIGYSYDGQDGVDGEDGSTTAVLRLIDNGSYAVVSQTSGGGFRQDWELHYNIARYDGNEVQMLTASDIKNKYYLWYRWDNSQSWSKRTSTTNELTASGGGSFSMTTGDSDHHSYLVCELHDAQSRMLDRVVVPLMMRSEAVFEVIQGAEARILATVTGGETEINGSITSLTQRMSQIEQSAQQISSTVTQHTKKLNELGQQIDSLDLTSEISQTADEIYARVSDGLQNTGIDITNGRITLEADQTEIHGALSLYDNDNGLIIYDEDHYPRIEITSDLVGRFDENNFISLLETVSTGSKNVNDSVTVVTTPTSIGQVVKNQTLAIRKINLWVSWWKNKMMMRNQSFSGTYKIMISNNTGGSGTIMKQGSLINDPTQQITTTISTFSYTVNFTGTAYVWVEFNCAAPPGQATSCTVTGKIYTPQASAPSCTRIGRDGMVSFANDNNYLYRGVDGTFIASKTVNDNKMNVGLISARNGQLLRYLPAIDGAIQSNFEGTSTSTAGDYGLVDINGALALKCPQTSEYHSASYNSWQLTQLMSTYEAQRGESCICLGHMSLQHNGYVHCVDLRNAGHMNGRKIVIMKTINTTVWILDGDGIGICGISDLTPSSNYSKLSLGAIPITLVYVNTGTSRFWKQIQ